MIEAKIVKDSISDAGKRITTFQLKYPRFIHSELMTHRVFSRNASSSRAIPVAKVLSQVWNDPAMPVHWGKNQAGMQAKGELTGIKLTIARALWKFSGKVVCAFAYAAMHVGLHKQVANRILEPWQYIHVVLTSTEWDNWYELRDHEDAQPEIRSLATAMRIEHDRSVPTWLKQGEWHLPYVTNREIVQTDIELLKKISAARCCRVSYLKHDGSKPNQVEDIALFNRLAEAEPLHASPLEHQACPMSANDNPNLQGNLKGWIQYRKQWELTFFKNGK